MIEASVANRDRNIALLNSAADLIDLQGWWKKGAPGNGPGMLCIVDALRLAVRQEAARAFPDPIEHDEWIDKKPQSLALFLAIHLQLPPIPSAVHALIEWNDMPGRTKQDVLAALRDTAKEMP